MLHVRDRKTLLLHRAGTDIAARRRTKNSVMYNGGSFSVIVVAKGKVRLFCVSFGVNYFSVSNIIQGGNCNYKYQIESHGFWNTLSRVFTLWLLLGPLFLYWFLGVVPFNTWLISSWEENKCCYKLSNCTKWHLFHSKWSKLSFWVK